MTFATKVKNELCKVSKNDGHSLSQLYGMLLFSHSFNSSEISVYSENENVCELICDLIKKEFNFDVEVLCSNVKENVTLKVSGELERKKVLNRFEYSNDEISLRINTNILNSEKCVKSFLRGAFLSCGTVTDPQNGYHLEFIVPFMRLSNDLFSLMKSLESLSVKAKMMKRKGKFIIYIKDSSDIIDFIAYMGASTCAMDMMQIKMIKEFRNYVNRTNNFETANMGKTALAAALQIDAIKAIKKRGLFNELDDDLKELARLRIENPEMSLRELGENLSHPITRSGVNYKMKKLLKIYENSL